MVVVLTSHFILLDTSLEIQREFHRSSKRDCSIRLHKDGMKNLAEKSYTKYKQVYKIHELIKYFQIALENYDETFIISV